MVKEYLTVEEAAKLTNLGKSTLSTLAKNGDIFAIKERNRWQLKSEDVLNLNIKPHKPHTRRPKGTVQKEVEAFDLVTGYAIDPELIGARLMPKHAKREDTRTWREIPRFTYDDLIEQYRRGIEEGKRLAKEEEQIC